MEYFIYNDKKIVFLLDKDNKPWFRGKDAAKILEYKDTCDAIRRHVPIEEQVKYRQLVESDSLPTSSYHGHARTIFITEIGLYTLIMKSRLSTAKDFKNWLVRHILPTLDKNGNNDAAEERARLENEIIRLTKELEFEKQKSFKLEKKYLHKNQ